MPIGIPRDAANFTFTREQGRIVGVNVYVNDRQLARHVGANRLGVADPFERPLVQMSTGATVEGYKDAPTRHETTSDGWDAHRVDISGIDGHTGANNVSLRVNTDQGVYVGELRFNGFEDK